MTHRLFYGSHCRYCKTYFARREYQTQNSCFNREFRDRRYHSNLRRNYSPSDLDNRATIAIRKRAPTKRVR